MKLIAESQILTETDKREQKKNKNNRTLKIYALPISAEIPTMIVFQKSEFKGEKSCNHGQQKN